MSISSTKSRTHTIMSKSVCELVEALIKGIRIITLRGVDDGGEERELDKTMSVMILGEIHVK